MNDYRYIASRMNRIVQVFRDTIEDELLRLGISGTITPVQALLLHGLGDQELCPTDLQRKGIYAGTNPHYNLKMLLKGEYLSKRSGSYGADRRRVLVKLTPKGQVIRKVVDDLIDRQSTLLPEPDMQTLRALLEALESGLTGSIRHLY